MMCAKTNTHDNASPDACPHEEEACMEEDGDHLEEHEEQPQCHLDDPQDARRPGGKAWPHGGRQGRRVQVGRPVSSHGLQGKGGGDVWKGKALLTISSR